jgi:ribonuclease E
MLVNATQQEELRVALVDGQKLFDLSIELTSREQKKANIYKGKISRVEPSLEACFVDYGAQRHGFLPLKEVSREYFRQSPAGGRMNIRDLLSEGQELMVQVEKEERGTKGAALTTFISLAGRFLVLMPNNPRAGGVSRRIEGEDRDQMREVMSQLQIPDGMGAIVRTAGVGRSVEELQWDLDNLRSQWDQIEAASKDRAAPFLVYRESDAVTRAMRDYLGDDVGEILVDDQAAFTKAQEYMQRFMPADAQRRLKLYADDIPLFTRFQIESQIESAYAHKVQLPSGGSIVIDYTEALVSIDINSARATRGSDIETTATNTNLEAAEEIARQLRIRDIGGLIVIDFIDMESPKNQRDVEDRLREAMKMDRARIQIGRLSRFGLLEMSRQRLRPSLSDSSHIVCPRCVGIGSIRSVESMALAILRLIGEELRKDRTSRVIAQVPVEVATYLINEKREWLRQLEDKSSAELIIVPNLHMQTPDYSLKRVRDDETEQAENKQASYLMPTAPVVVEPGSAQDQKPAPEVAAVATILPATSAPISVPVEPVVQPPAEPERHLGVLGRFKRWLVGDPAPEPVAAAAPATTATSSSGSHSRRGERDRVHRRDRDGRRGDHRSHRREDGPRRDREPGGEGSREASRERDAGRDAHRDRHRGEGRGGEGRGGEQRAAEGRGRDGDRNRDRNRGQRDGNREARDGGREGREAGREGREGGREGGRESGREREQRGQGRGEPRQPRVEDSTSAAANVGAANVGGANVAGVAAAAAAEAGAMGGDVAAAPGASDEARLAGGERGERRGRRGRRRGRRGGGGSRDANGNRIAGGGGASEGGAEGGEHGGSGSGDFEGQRATASNGAGHGSHEHGSHEHRTHEHGSHEQSEHSHEAATREHSFGEREGRSREQSRGEGGSGSESSSYSERQHEAAPREHVERQHEAAPREHVERQHESAPREHVERQHESPPREHGERQHESASGEHGERNGEQRSREVASGESRGGEPHERESRGSGERSGDRSSESRSAARESAPPAPVAHFEPPARPETAGQTRPYVVWSSAPTDHGSAGGREE